MDLTHTKYKFYSQTLLTSWPTHISPAVSFPLRYCGYKNTQKRTTSFGQPIKTMVFGHLPITSNNYIKLFFWSNDWDFIKNIGPNKSKAISHTNTRRRPDQVGLTIPFKYYGLGKLTLQSIGPNKTRHSNLWARAEPNSQSSEK